MLRKLIDLVRRLREAAARDEREYRAMGQAPPSQAFLERCPCVSATGEPDPDCLAHDREGRRVPVEPGDGGR